MQSVQYIQRNVTTREKSLIGAIHDQWESSILRLCFAIMLSAPYIHREIWDKQPSSLFGRYNLPFVIRFNIELRPLAFSSLLTSSNLFIASLVSINIDNWTKRRKRLQRWSTNQFRCYANICLFFNPRWWYLQQLYLTITINDHDHNDDDGDSDIYIMMSVCLSVCL